MGFEFKCPSCHQKLEAENDWAGISLECPLCNKIILVPDHRPKEQENDFSKDPDIIPLAKTERKPVEEVKYEAPPPPPLSTPTPLTERPKYTVAKTIAPGAIASLAWGIVGLFICGFILGVVAISKASSAKALIKSNPEDYSGGGIATAGLIIGIIDIAGWVLILILRMVG